MKGRVCLLFAVLMPLTGCATITRGSITVWEVQTDPPGATVETTYGDFCESTPCAMKVPRKSEFSATIKKAGYETVTVSVTNRVAGAGSAGMAGNVIFGGLIGAGFDAASGAMLDLVPNPVMLKLVKVPQPSADVLPPNVDSAEDPPDAGAPPSG